MGLIIGLSVLVLFLAACAWGVLFAIKRRGLRQVSVYASYAIGVRLLLGAFHSDEIGGQVLHVIAGVILLLWPYVLEHRAKEKELMRREEAPLE
jgi:hypothetical protein